MSQKEARCRQDPGITPRKIPFKGKYFLLCGDTQQVFPAVIKAISSDGAGGFPFPVMRYAEESAASGRGVPAGNPVPERA